MSIRSGTVARRRVGASDPFLRRELHGRVLVLARGLGFVFAVLALVMYARWLPRWLDLRLAVARHAASLPGGSSFYPGIAMAAAVAAIVASLAWGVLAGQLRDRFASVPILAAIRCRAAPADQMGPARRARLPSGLLGRDSAACPCPRN